MARPLPRSRRPLSRAGAVLLIVAVLAGCGAEPPQAAQPTGPRISGTTVSFDQRPEGIRTAPVLDAGSTALSLPGRLAWDEDRTVRVAPPIGGRVLRALAQVGDTVKAGAPLAELASPDFGQAVADGRRADSELRLAEDTLSRLRELHEAGLVPAKDLREAEASARRASIERQRAQARLAQLGAAGGSGAGYVLRAPIAGVVVERSINAGQELRAEAAGSLFTITDPTRLWAWIDAPESALPQLAPLPAGMPFKVRSGAWGDRDFDAQLLRTEDAIDPASRTFRLRLAVENPKRLLKAEMFVTATTELPEDRRQQQVEEMPASAVLLIDGRRHVFVEDGRNAFRRLEVQVVRDLPGRVGVIGLDPGQRVVVEGNLYLQQILARRGDPAQANAGTSR